MHMKTLMEKWYVAKNVYRNFDSHVHESIQTEFELGFNEWLDTLKYIIDSYMSLEKENKLI